MDRLGDLGVPNSGRTETGKSIMLSDEPQGKPDSNQIWSVIDLFSGAGGMSCGFARRPPFRIVGAIDAEHSKPSSGFGSLGCNDTYAKNIGVYPDDDNIAELDPNKYRRRVSERLKGGLRSGDLTVLIACPPCVDFSRTKPSNHLVDSEKNSLVEKTGDFVEAFLPEFVVMENARELIMGRQSHHYENLKARMTRLGYDVIGKVFHLESYGLPQYRERAIVIASRVGRPRTLDELWEGWQVVPSAITVRHAIGRYSRVRLEAGGISSSDPMHRCPAFASDVVRRRMEAVPRDGGSWFDLAQHPEAKELLIPSMKDRLRRGDLGSHGDVYGRLAWRRPSPTVKRECGHVGNGRYAHPDQTRLLSLREMAALQGFPEDYEFVSSSLTNNYRHIGDAVPPLISYQLSAIVRWIKTGDRGGPEDWILPKSCLSRKDVAPSQVRTIQLGVA